jgi:hypothetical protein
MLNDNQVLRIRKTDLGLNVELETVTSNAIVKCSSIIGEAQLNCSKTPLLMRLEGVIIFLQKKSENFEL